MKYLINLPKPQMKIINFIKRLFVVRELTWDERVVQLLKNMDYKQVDPATWQMMNGPCHTRIIFMNGGVHIKVYGYGYGESDFLPGPIDDLERLKRFIESNQV